MCDIQIIKAVIGCALAIIGILLVLWGSKLFSRHINVKIGIGIPLAGIGIFMLSVSLPEYSTALYVLATLVLAFAAFWSVNITIQHESSTRSEDRDLEFKRRSLDEIMSWIKEVHRQCLLPRDYLGVGIVELKTALYTLQVESDWIEHTAHTFGGNFQKQVIEFTTAFRTYFWKSMEVSDRMDVAKELKQLLDSRDKVLEAAIELKRKHKL